MEVGGAVAAAAQGQPGHRGGSAFLVQEPLVVGLFGDVGGQVLQDAGPEGPQLPRPELVGLGDQQRLGLGQQVLAEILGQCLQRLADHPGLGQVHRRTPERGAHLGPALVQGCCEPGVGPDPAGSVTGRGGQPGRRRPVAGGLGDVVGGGQHPELLGLGAGDHPRQPHQQLLLLTGPAELRRDPSQVVQPTVDPSQGLGVGGGHGTSQPSTTDRGPGSEPLIHKGFREMRHQLVSCRRNVPSARMRPPPSGTREGSTRRSPGREKEARR